MLVRRTIQVMSQPANKSARCKTYTFRGTLTILPCKKIAYNLHLLINTEEQSYFVKHIQSFIDK